MYVSINVTLEKVIFHKQQTPRTAKVKPRCALGKAILNLNFSKESPHTTIHKSLFKQFISGETNHSCQRWVFFPTLQLHKLFRKKNIDIFNLREINLQMPCVVMNGFFFPLKCHTEGVLKIKGKQTNPGRCSRAPLLPK